MLVFRGKTLILQQNRRCTMSFNMLQFGGMNDFSCIVSTIRNEAMTSPIFSLLCPILLHTSLQTIDFHFPKTLKLSIVLWETGRIYCHRSRMLSPLIKFPDQFFYSSVVWCCSKRLVQGRKGPVGARIRPEDRDGVGFFVAQRTDHGFQEQCN